MFSTIDCLRVSLFSTIDCLRVSVFSNIDCLRVSVFLYRFLFLFISVFVP